MERPKVLTVSIAAFNMEAYIRDTMESLMDDRLLDSLEIFVVDDGGTDRTLRIVQEYADRYPGSVFPVHKENGGWGSTVNWSILHAHGRYFKCLDGDDWFDREGLFELICALKNSDADIVVTGYKTGTDETHLKEARPMLNRVRGSGMINEPVPGFLFGMWELTYKTDILRRPGLRLPEHTLYTDSLLAAIPFAFADSIQFLEKSVYCYRTGRAGQSVSREARIRHRQDAQDNCARLCAFYQENVRSGRAVKNKAYLKRRITKYCTGTVRTLLLCGITKETLGEVIAFEKRIQSISPEIYENVAECGKAGRFIKLMRKTDYHAFWLLRLAPGGIHNWT